MKWTKKKIVYTIIEALFFAVAPLIFIFVQYSTVEMTERGVDFVISFTGIVLALIVFLLFKKIFLKKRLDKISAKIVNHESKLETERDQQRIADLENAMKKHLRMETVLNSIMPLLLLVALVILCRALEEQLVKLSGVFGFCAISYVLGTVFAFLNAGEVVGKFREVGRRDNNN